MTQTRTPSVAVIGAGMTGILMAMRLRESGIDDITIFEKADRLGGTWRENTYPGVACDVPAHMYTYSFAGNPEWSNRYAHGDEIQAYFERVAKEQGVSETIRYNEGIEDSHYSNGKWQLRTSKGNQFEVDFVVCATGILHHPAYPDIEGMDNFKGEMFHTARWNHDVSLAGKRIGIIGTGSTATQVISEVSKQAGKLTVFQRTAQWIFPLQDKPYSESAKATLRGKPGRQRLLHRWYSFLMRNIFSEAVIGSPIQRRLMDWVVKRNLRKQVADPVLRAKLTPDYEVGCKRLIFSATFFDAMQQDNVVLETDAIERITERGVLTKDGVEHELDILVLATGFHPFNFMRPMNLSGRDGITIDEAWRSKVQAYRSVCLPGFPNFFLMLGPNTPIGNYSVIAMSEAQADYVLKLIDLWRKGELDAIEATEEAKTRYNAYLKAGMGKTVWVGGCQSWYMDDDGDLAMWPYSWNQWLSELSTPELADFHRKTPVAAMRKDAA